MQMVLPVVTFHTRTFSASDPEASREPRGDQARLLTLARWPGYVYSSLPVAASQTCTVLSSEPEAIMWPSGDQASVFTRPLCLVYVRRRFPEATSHICILLNSRFDVDARAIIRPSG